MGQPADDLEAEPSDIADDGAVADGVTLDGGAPPPRPRWLRWVGLAAALVVVVAAAVLIRRYAWLPHHRPSLESGQAYGVDVSHYQGDIDWDAVADDDISFAYIKATEGGDWVDEEFAANWAGARSAGIAVGAYHFFTLCRTGRDQAANFLRVVPVVESDLPLSVDLEFPMNCVERPAVDDLHRELAVFLETVESATGRPVVLYVEDEFDDRYRVSETFDRPVWHRSILDHPDDIDWSMWQFIDFARVDGIDGGVDMNVMADVAEMSRGSSVG